MEHSMHFCCSFTSRVWLCDPWTTAPRLPCPSLSPRVCSNSCPLSWCHLTIIICRSLLLMSSIFPSIQVYSNDSALCIRWPKYWSFSFRISPSNEYSGLISFRIDWFDLAVQETLKSFLQHYNLKESVLQCSAFFMIQLSHLYMTTAKTIALTWWIFVGKLMSLLFSMFRYVIAFLPRSKCLLISWLQSPSAVTVSIHQPPIHLPVSNGTKCPDLVFWVLSFFFNFYLFIYFWVFVTVWAFL